MVFVKKYSTSPYNFFVKNYINYLLKYFFQYIITVLQSIKSDSNSLNLATAMFFQLFYHLFQNQRKKIHHMIY